MPTPSAAYMSLIAVYLHMAIRLFVVVDFDKKIKMKKLICLLVIFGLCGAANARTDSGGKGGKNNGQRSSQKYNNPSGGENCHYCWKDLSIDYTPSRHKYAKKS